MVNTGLPNCDGQGFPTPIPVAAMALPSSLQLLPKAVLPSEDHLEEDISDGSPYLTIHSVSTAASSGTDISDLSTATPSRSSFPLEFDVPYISQSLSRKKSFESPSSPNRQDLARPVSLVRSLTLPRVFQVDGPRHRRRQSELDKLYVSQDVVKRIRRWVLGIAFVNFDVDDGPIVDGIYPSSIFLPSESQNIAFCSLPDSPQFDQGSQIHSFRVREQLRVNTEKRPATKDGFIYGYSYFTQKKDSSSKRGYEQRSVVILTQHQYPAFFSKLVSILGPLLQTHGAPMLESACHNISTWHDPIPGETLELGFLGSVLRLELPHTVDEHQLTETASFQEKYDTKPHILASSPPLQPPPLLLFGECLSHLWSIWECLVLCEPILVFGPSPAQTSQAVWWLRDLLRPIPLAGDIRPYFTVQDVDHSLLVNRLPPKPGVLLGVTNPFFEKSCAHWPHILSLGQRKKSGGGARTPVVSSAGPAPGWKTKTHRRYISKDRALLKQLEVACSGNDETRLDASLLLRRHFCSRTTALITPVARYLNTLIPSPVEVDRARRSSSPLRLKPFNSAHFFVSLKANGSTLPFRSTSRRTEFYERWLKTPGFGLWLAQQERIVEGVLKEGV